MKSLMQLIESMLQDGSIVCRVSTHLDLKTIKARIEHEGLSFLTITLADYGAKFETWLSNGQISDDLCSFKSRAGFPVFLQGFLRNVFDTDTLLLRDDVCIHSVRFLRQFLLMWKKINLPCSKNRERAAYADYISTDNEVRDWTPDFGSPFWVTFQRIADMLYGPRLSDVDRKAYSGTFVPKHGPGATAERVSGNSKYQLRQWTERLERAGFGATEYAIPNLGYSDDLESIDFVTPLDETPVRVISVPKTLKTPRIIAIEPVCIQYAQQSILEPLVPILESRFENALGFTDQSVNQRLAREGSIDGSLSTIDLSSASDRVSNLLVYKILKTCPNLLRLVQATRSLRADVPGYGVRTIYKFASMGSALCFPIEAMVFLTVVLTGLHMQQKRYPTNSSIVMNLRKVRIYGDDIIVPVEYTQSVIQALEESNLKVNYRKTFFKGNFRESCGGDYFRGEQVTPVYLRSLLPEDGRLCSEHAQMISFRNQLYLAGYWKTVMFLDRKIKQMKLPFPIAEPTCPGHARISFLGYKPERMCDRLHRPLVKALVSRPKYRKKRLDDSRPWALMKFFLKRSIDPINGNHLEQSGRPDSVDIKVRWVTPF